VCCLQDAILRYNTAHAKKWDFTALNLLCTEVSCSRTTKIHSQVSGGLMCLWTEAE